MKVISLEGVYLEITFETVDKMRQILDFILECVEKDKKVIPRNAGLQDLVDRVVKLIKGVKGEFYFCKPDIFKLTYDERK